MFIQQYHASKANADTRAFLLTRGPHKKNASLLTMIFMRYRQYTT